MDNDGELTDGLSITEWLFLGADEPSGKKTADVNGDDDVTISDISRLLTYLFLGGSAPVAPFPCCGTGKAETTLDCETYAPCAESN